MGVRRGGGDVDNFSRVGHTLDRMHKQRLISNLKHIEHFQMEELLENKKDDFQIMLENIASKPLHECLKKPRSPTATTNPIVNPEQAIVYSQLQKYYQQQRDLFPGEAIAQITPVTKPKRTTRSPQLSPAAHRSSHSSKSNSNHAENKQSLQNKANLPLATSPKDTITSQTRMPRRPNAISTDTTDSRRKTKSQNMTSSGKSQKTKFTSFYGQNNSLKNELEYQFKDNLPNNPIPFEESMLHEAQHERIQAASQLSDDDTESKDKQRFFSKIIPMNAALKITPYSQAGLCGGILREAVKQQFSRNVKQRKLDNPYSPKSKRKRQQPMFAIAANETIESQQQSSSFLNEHNNSTILITTTATTTPAATLTTTEAAATNKKSYSSPQAERFLESIQEKSEKAKRYLTRTKIIEAGGTCQESDELDSSVSSDASSSDADSLKSYLPKVKEVPQYQLPRIMQPSTVSQKKQNKYQSLETTQSLRNTPQQLLQTSSVQRGSLLNSKRSSVRQQQQQFSTAAVSRRNVEFNEIPHFMDQSFDNEAQPNNLKNLRDPNRFHSINASRNNSLILIEDEVRIRSSSLANNQLNTLPIKNREYPSVQRSSEQKFETDRNTVTVREEISQPNMRLYNSSQNSSSYSTNRCLLADVSGRKVLNSKIPKSPHSQQHHEYLLPNITKEELRENAARVRAYAYIRSQEHIYPAMDWDKHETETLQMSKIDALSNKSKKLQSQFIKISTQMKKELVAQERVSTKKQSVEEMIVSAAENTQARRRNRQSTDDEMSNLLNDQFYIALEDETTYQKIKHDQESRLENLQAYHHHKQGNKQQHHPLAQYESQLFKKSGL